MKGLYKKLTVKIFAVIFTVTLLLCCFAACGNGNSNKIVVMGSTSVQPYAELLAHEFEQIHKARKVKIDVTGGGSAAGITAANNGYAQIGMSSRNLKEAEKAGLDEFVIATDGLAIIINPNNPILKKTGGSSLNLTSEQVRDIYSGGIKEWNDEKLGGDKGEIHVITREDGSGTRTAFEDFIMNKQRIINTAAVSSANGFIRYQVSVDAGAIGFISLGLVDGENKVKGNKPVVAVSLDGVDATEANIENGTYGLSRPFIFMTKGEPEGLAKEFIEFVTGGDGKAVLKAKGLFV